MPPRLPLQLPAKPTDLTARRVGVEPSQAQQLSGNCPTKLIAHSLRACREPSDGLVVRGHVEVPQRARIQAFCDRCDRGAAVERQGRHPRRRLVPFKIAERAASIPAPRSGSTWRRRSTQRSIDAVVSNRRAARVAHQRVMKSSCSCPAALLRCVCARRSGQPLPRLRRAGQAAGQCTDRRVWRNTHAGRRRAG